jgi:predicted nucleic acid-binding protein
VTQRLLISDANILIDMEEGSITGQMFQLDAVFAVPDLLYEEELREEHSYLPELGLRTLELTGETIAYAEALISRYARTGASTNDLLALALARQEKTTLLTGDDKLRRVAESERVACHGTLWLVEQLVTVRLLTITDAKTAYARMKAAGRRLPWDEAMQRLNALTGKSGNR